MNLSETVSDKLLSLHDLDPPALELASLEWEGLLQEGWSRRNESPAHRVLAHAGLAGLRVIRVALLP